MRFVSRLDLDCYVFLIVLSGSSASSIVHSAMAPPDSAKADSLRLGSDRAAHSPECALHSSIGPFFRSRPPDSCSSAEQSCCFLSTASVDAMAKACTGNMASAA